MTRAKADFHGAAPRAKLELLALPHQDAADRRKLALPTVMNNASAEFESSGWFPWNLEAARVNGNTSIAKAPEQGAFSGLQEPLAARAAWKSLRP